MEKFMEETEAIELLKMKKPQGLAWLVEKYQLKAIRAAYLITQDAPSAEDVVQDKFVDLYRNVRSFDTSRPFAPWFFRSVVNAAISAARSERKYAGTLEEFESLMGSLPNPEGQLQQKELERSVQKAVEQLSTGARAVVVMRYYLDWSEAEIAEVAQAPLGTIKWRLHAARKTLRSILAPMFGKEKDK
jgi:RNA polymerase sigma-70 factor (ECF subfamily)